MRETLNIFNIQRYSLHDGEGIRTVIFLKGCPLRCRWCCNPESQNACAELMYRRKQCIGLKNCGRCRIWNRQAGEEIVTFGTDGRCCLDLSKADPAGLDPGVCPAGAVSVVGETKSIAELLEIAERDAAFYGSDGGITLSGGEPLMQENAVVLLKEAKKRYLGTSIETCGYVPEERLLEAAQYLDQIYMDVKSLNDEKHKAYTGVSGERIRGNLSALCKAFPDKNITVRTPVIPGFNDSEEELEKIENFLAQFKQVKWQKLPYHEYGAGKYAMLGRRYSLQP